MILADTLCSSAQDCGLPGVSLSSGTLNTILGNVFLALGVLAVIFIIIGGVRYAISGGDSANVKQAKETILYAVIGLIVALIAFTIVYLAAHVAGTGRITP
jgi:succinate dehydrogenase/fumarate reductase cytochrome b subunit